MPTAVVLGAGMVGSVMAVDLAADAGWSVTVADGRAEALRAAQDRARAAGVTVAAVNADLSSPAELRRAIEPADIVLGALSSALGFVTLRRVIEAGKNYADIAFMPEDALELDASAKSRGVTAVVDCGVAPGMSNMIAGHEVAALAEPRSVAIYVGGLPRDPRPPFLYKAGFAPADVIEEYTRPARLVEHGRVVVREALSEPEFLDFAGLGRLEAVNTDGLRSLVRTLPVPFMKEKTLRYPGHYDLMRAFAATGLFGKEPIEVGGGAARVSPRDVLASLMFPKWTYAPGEEDLTVMRIVVEGVRHVPGGVRGGAGGGGGRAAGGADLELESRVTWDLVDFYDRRWGGGVERGGGATSMARTTALPATTVARRIAAGELGDAGVIPPELLGSRPGFLESIVAELARKGIMYARSA